jgi:hypothetical protein
MNTTRRSALLASAGLVVAGLAVVATATPTVANSAFTERWCGLGQAAPCVVSATLNGTAMHKGDPIKIRMVPVQSEASGSQTELIVGDPSKTVALKTTDKISVLVDTGKLKPESTESYASRPDVDRYDDHDGTYRMRVTGSPVLLTSGCADSYPNYCTDTAQTQETVFDVTVLKLKVNKEFIGFDRSQSADTVDGLYLKSSRAGDYLETNWDNSRYLTDGSTLAKAEARFRIPYAMLITDFNVPDPSTMVSSSIAGSVNGVPASFELSQDPKGGAVFVDISGVTFPPGTARLAAGSKVASKPRIIRVKRGAITPARPTLTKVRRVGGTKARVTFARARARGAKVTAYQARCVSAGHKTLTASGRAPSVVVKGLTRGRGYQCSVRAKSKVGYGAWSLRKKI